MKNMSSAKNNIYLKQAEEWFFLSVLTAVCVSVLHYGRVPASPLAGAMIAAIIAAASGKMPAKVHSAVFQSAQSVLGCMIARIFTLTVLQSILKNWLTVFICVFFMLLCSFVMGYFLSVKKVLPGTSAVWGAWPGGAMTMVILSENYGADMRLVAFMQYMRVVIVALTASMVTRFFGADIGANPHFSFRSLFSHEAETEFFILTLIFAAVCVLSARKFRIPAGSLLLPMFSGAVLINTGILEISLPQWMLTAVYVIIGWSIGLRFDKETLKHAFKAFPKVLASIFILIILCAAASFVLVRVSGIDPLTAYLAVSPGGADSIAIIASSVQGLNKAFIMSVQVMRFVVILMIGPYTAKRLTLYLNKKRETELSSF